MKVKISILAQGAYVSITAAGAWLDVLLPAGKSAANGLRQREAEYLEKAARMEKYAKLCAKAAAKLEAQA